MDGLAENATWNHLNQDPVKSGSILDELMMPANRRIEPNQEILCQIETFFLPNFHLSENFPTSN